MSRLPKFYFYITQFYILLFEKKITKTIQTDFTAVAWENSAFSAPCDCQ